MGNLAALFQLEPGVAFLNHGSYGACPIVVFEAYQGFQCELERQPVAFLEPTRGWSDRLAAVRAVVAAEIGAEARDLVGVANATEAVNIVAQSLVLGPGDEVLMTDHEYGAMEKLWDFVCKRSGARVVVAEVPLPLTGDEAFTKAMVAAMTTRTRVVFLSHVTSATALVLPIAGVVAEARRRGIWTVIDGAHAPGLLALDMQALGADFYAGNGHKWWMAPKGAGFLWARREMQGLLRPLVISHFVERGFPEAFEMQGTRDPAAWLALPAALRFRREQGWERVAAACAAMAREVVVWVGQRSGMEPLSDAEFGAGQMVALPVPGCDVAALKLFLEGQRVEVPCYQWKGHCIVRLSVQGYNSAADLDRLQAGLARFFGW